MKPIDIAIIGNAPVDYLTHTTDAVLARFNLKKGDWQRVPPATMAALLAASADIQRIGGGSGANTGYNMHMLSAKVYFGGVVGSDDDGLFFHRAMRTLGVAMAAPLPGLVTLRLLCLITPDGERTFVSDGSATPAPDRQFIPAATLAQSRWLLLEAYALDDRTPEILRTCAQARQNGVKVALTMASPTHVHKHRSTISQLVAGGLDLILCNDAEHQSLQQTAEIATLPAFATTPLLVTHGPLGATYMAYGQKVFTPCPPVAKVVDTTGAGDAFAAGFLYGLVRGLGTTQAMRLGHSLAGATISHVGARLPHGHGDLLKAVLNAA